MRGVLACSSGVEIAWFFWEFQLDHPTIDFSIDVLCVIVLVCYRDAATTRTCGGYLVARRVLSTDALY